MIDKYIFSTYNVLIKELKAMKWNIISHSFSTERYWLVENTKMKLRTSHEAGH